MEIVEFGKESRPASGRLIRVTRKDIPKKGGKILKEKSSTARG